MNDNLVLSQYEQCIYNAYLRISRTKRNLPYRSRKTFDNLDTVTGSYIKKIAIFLAKFDYIKLDDFLQAPFVVYPDEDYFGLDYFTTLKAIKAYTIFQKKRAQFDPDSDEQLKNIIDSLKFISVFCKEHGICIDEYIEHNTNNTPSYILHLKEHRVNVYSLLGFINFERSIRSQDIEIVKFILGEDFFNALPNFRVKFFASKKAKILIEQGIQKIKHNTIKNTNQLA